MIPQLAISTAPTIEPWETLTLNKGERAYQTTQSRRISLVGLVLISSLPCISNIGHLQLYLDIHGSELELHLYIRASPSIYTSLLHPRLSLYINYQQSFHPFLLTLRAVSYISVIQRGEFTYSIVILLENLLYGRTGSIPDNYIS